LDWMTVFHPSSSIDNDDRGLLVVNFVNPGSSETFLTLKMVEGFPQECYGLILLAAGWTRQGLRV
jgi:hypothetical protein